MALTTTSVNACDASVWLDTLAGTSTDISGSSNNVSLNFTLNLGEIKAFGSRWPVRRNCGKDCTATLSVLYSTAADEGLDVLKDWFFSSAPNSRTLKVYLPDKNVGSDLYSGEFQLESLDIPVVANEATPINVTASLKSDGEVTLTTNAT
jgi:hypothetical protein